ncbi:MBL fold metallo-hydrolase [Oerskovia sp. M15]
MEYTGDVTVGGPSDLRVLDEVEIRKLAVGPSHNNAYLLTCRGSGAQLLIDAAAEADRLVALVREGSGSARLDLVVTTHRHRDHVGALESVVAVTGTPVAVGAPDADAVTEATGVTVARRLHDGDTVVVGHLTLQVVALRGHTPARSRSRTANPSTRAPGRRPGRAHLFTGDSCSPVGGQHPAGPRALRASVHRRQAETLRAVRRRDVGLPGHGADTTLGPNARTSTSGACAAGRPPDQRVQLGRRARSQRDTDDPGPARCFNGRHADLRRDLHVRRQARRPGRVPPRAPWLPAPSARRGVPARLGSLAQDVSNPAGALLLVDAPDEAALAATLDADPFARENVITRRTVRPWSP